MARDKADLSRRERLRAAGGNWARFLRWTRRVDLAAKLEMALAAMALVMGVTTYTMLSAEGDPLPQSESPSITLVLILTLLPLLGLAALIARRFVMLWAERRKNSAGSRLHGRVVFLFSLVAIVPTLLVAIFSSLQFEFGLRLWFSDRVATVLNSAATVAEAYVAEHRKYLGEDIRAMAADLNRGAPIYEQDLSTLQKFVGDQMIFRDLSEAIVFDSSMRVLARASRDVHIGTQGLARGDFERAVNGDIVIITNPEEETDRVRALIRLSNFFDAYLYVSRLVDAKVLKHYYETKSALSEYRQLRGQRSATQLRFNIVLILVSLAILLAAIVVGLWFATRLVRPVGHLLQAAERIRQGDMSARVPLRGAMDEIGVLARAFNRMTSQLQAQTNELMAANQQLDTRRRFTEAVLEGVTAGVLGLSAEGRINLANASASELLERAQDQLIGRDIATISPAMAELLGVATQDPDGHAEARVNLEIGDGVERSLLVQVVAEREPGAVTGYVVTFDDITERLADQRRAAWADVARRIAHEIKNPLTPIQLSAERLRRKYSREIQTDPAVFEQCTSTIIRQVGDLRRMVDEFSSFARMPVPVFRHENVIDVVRQAMFLQEIGHPGISYHLDVPDALDLVCDRRLIAQAATNMLKNAAESIEQRFHAQPPTDDPATRHGAITVRIRRDDDTTRIEIEDDGRGLPPEIRNRLFEPYVTTRAKGTGLGLAIVKKIVEDHDGELNLEDREAGGVRATMTFDHHKLAARIELGEAASATGA